MFCTAVFSALLGVFAFSGESMPFITAVLAFFLLLGIWLIVEYANWRIEYGETEFAFRNGVGISRTRRLDEVLIIERAGKIILHFADYKIAIVRACKGLPAFVESVERAMNAVSQ